jgi:hypothetical protein
VSYSDTVKGSSHIPQTKNEYTYLYTTNEYPNWPHMLKVYVLPGMNSTVSLFQNFISDELDIVAEPMLQADFQLFYPSAVKRVVRGVDRGTATSSEQVKSMQGVRRGRGGIPDCMHRKLAAGS